MTTFALFIISSFFLGVFLWNKKPIIAHILMLLIAIFLAYAYFSLGKI